MTNEEAIKMIKDDVRLHHDHLSGKYRKALRMAIEALSCSKKPNESDPISRADIEWHDYLVADGNGMYHDEKVAYKSQIDMLPSAQPEIIQCKDCYWWEKQEASLQGRCDRYGFYPTGYWYCAGARERKENETD